MVRILYNSKFNLTSKIAWNKHGRYKRVDCTMEHPKFIVSYHLEEPISIQRV